MDFGWCWGIEFKSSRKDMKSVIPEGVQWIKMLFQAFNLKTIALF